MLIRRLMSTDMLVCYKEMLKQSKEEEYKRFVGENSDDLWGMVFQSYKMTGELILAWKCLRLVR